MNLEITFLPAMQARWDEIVNGFIAEKLIDSKDDAITKMNEILKGTFAKKLAENFKGLNNEFSQNYLIDSFRDDIARGLISPVIKTRILVETLRAFDAPIIVDKKPTGNKIRKCVAVGSISILNPKSNNWEEPRAGEVSGEGKFSDLLEDNLKENMVFELSTISGNTSEKAKYIFMKVDDRCKTKIEKINEKMPPIEEVLRKSYDKMNIHDYRNHNSEGTFDFRYVECRVCENPNIPRGGSKKASFHVSDSSVTTQDIALHGKKAFITVFCDPSLITFGKDTILSVLGPLNYQSDSEFGAAMFSPRVMKILLKTDLPEASKRSTESVKSNAEDAKTIMERVQRRTSTSIIPPPITPPVTPLTVPTSTSTPTPSTSAVKSDSEYLGECPSWGHIDQNDMGCIGCFKDFEAKGKDSTHIYATCLAKSK